MKATWRSAAALALLAISSGGWMDRVHGQDETDAGLAQQVFDGEESEEDSAELENSSEYFVAAYERSHELGAGSGCSGENVCGDLYDGGGCDGSCHCACGCCLPTVPNMMGDSIGLPVVFGFAAGEQAGIPGHYIKASDNNNVLPQTRFGVGINHYKNTAVRWTRPGGDVVEEKDLTEYKFVFEKAMADETFSLHLVLPLYDTVSYTQTTIVGGTLPLDKGTEFGNLAFGFKKLLRHTETGAVTAGLLTEAPTARGLSLYGQTVANDQWFFTPYLAVQRTPSDRVWAQAFAGYRMRTGDNAYTGIPGAPHVIHQDRLMLDGALGYWMYRNDDSRVVTGLSPTVELHYTTFTEDGAPTHFATEWFNRSDMLNLTLGATAELSNGGTLASGIVLPMRQGNFPGSNLPTDRMMDWELIVQYNCLF